MFRLFYHNKKHVIECVDFQLSIFDVNLWPLTVDTNAPKKDEGATVLHYTRSKEQNTFLGLSEVCSDIVIVNCVYFIYNCFSLKILNKEEKIKNK